MKKAACIITVSLLFLFLIWGTSFSVYGQNYLDPPRVIKNPSTQASYAPAGRKFTGIPSLAVHPGGTMWAVWYAGISPGEDLNNYVVVSASRDQGKTWKEVAVIDPDGPGPVRAYDPEIWLAPDGKIMIFWAQAAAQSGGTWSLVTDGTLAGVWSMSVTNPESADPVFTEPRRLTDGVMMCKPLVLSTGEWVLPASYWKMDAESARMVVSTDGGITWSVRGGASVPDDVRSYDEHMLVERKDGSLWMLIRTKYGMGESVSHNRGHTWSPVVPSRLQHPAARFFIRRLNSGNLLLVKHGPVDLRTGRSHLMAFVSGDEGFTWSDGLLLDERPGVSYPDGQQTSDGTIYITYDYARTKDQNILFTSFSEAEVTRPTGRAILEVYNRRRVISQGGMKQP